MEDFVPSTRRWFDRVYPRDAGEWDACQTVSFLFDKLTVSIMLAVFLWRYKVDYSFNNAK